jgi:(1->4)-alpha-D-glucan 1-alpha-D-glucosylmutase
VDYPVRRGVLGGLAGAGPEEALARSDEGGPKLWLIHRVLGHRGRHPDAYGPGSGYEPLHVRGPGARHAVAFARTGGLAVIVPRLVASLDEAWPGTTVGLPDGDWIDVLTGDKADGGDVSVATLLRRFPVAILGREA